MCHIIYTGNHKLKLKKKSLKKNPFQTVLQTTKPNGNVTLEMSQTNDDAMVKLYEPII